MQRTVLIGLDGATFTVLDHLMDVGVMPYLKEFVRQGMRSKLLSTVNPITPPAWISIVTGRSPGNHGIFDFLRPEERESGLVVRFNNSADIKCETMWSIVSRQNQRVASFNFYGMNPPFPVSGYMVSGFVTWKHLKRATHPPEFYDTMRSHLQVNLKEIGFNLEQEKKCFQGGIPEEDSEAWIRSHIRRERYWLEILRYVMRNDPCDLTAVVFDGVDKIQHLFWRYLNPTLLPPALTPFEQNIRELCLQYFSQIDRFIFEIVSMAGENSQVFIVSDHGFSTTIEIFYLNKWLHDKGYLRWVDPENIPRFGKLTVDRLSSHVGLLDWEKTAVYGWTPSSNGIFIRIAKKDGQPGIKPEQYNSFRENLRQDLLSFEDTSSGGNVIKAVYTKEEAFPGKYTHLAPDLTLILRDSGLVSIVNSDTSLKPRLLPAGCHHAEGVFIARGRGIRKGISIPQLSIIDVAPSILYSLGLPVPNDFEGGVPTEIFEKDFLVANPVRIGESTKPVLDSKEERPESPDEKETLMSQLRVLGYM